MQTTITRGGVNSPQDTHKRSTADANPEWIIFRAGPYAVRLPFADMPYPADDGWQYVLDVTALGFRADRIGDAVVITGRPSDNFGGLAS